MFNASPSRHMNDMNEVIAILTGRKIQKLHIFGCNLTPRFIRQFDQEIKPLKVNHMPARDNTKKLRGRPVPM